MRPFRLIFILHCTPFYSPNWMYLRSNLRTFFTHHQNTWLTPFSMLTSCTLWAERSSPVFHIWHRSIVSCFLSLRIFSFSLASLRRFSLVSISSPLSPLAIQIFSIEDRICFKGLYCKQIRYLFEWLSFLWVDFRQHVSIEDFQHFSAHYNCARLAIKAPNDPQALSPFTTLCLFAVWRIVNIPVKNSSEDSKNIQGRVKEDREVPTFGFGMVSPYGYLASAPSLTGLPHTGLILIPSLVQCVWHHGQCRFMICCSNGPTISWRQKVRNQFQSQFP